MVDTDGNEIPEAVANKILGKIQELIDTARTHGYKVQTPLGSASFRKVDKPYPCRVCNDCGLMYGSPWTCSTWHTATCEVCGKTTSVTEPRDFRYPIFPGHELP